MEDEQAGLETDVIGTPDLEDSTITNTNSSNEETNLKDSFQNRRSKKIKKDKTTEIIDSLEKSLAERNDQYLRLHAEFDNYRKRTLREKMELTKSAGESLLINILPVIDDFERAMKAMETATEIAPVKEGIDLIYKRFTDFIKINGIKEIDAIEKDFNTDMHEAITKIPSPNEEMKGKVVDVIQKGYTLNDKVIRFAKVVIGE